MCVLSASEAGRGRNCSVSKTPPASCHCLGPLVPWFVDTFLKSLRLLHAAPTPVRVSACTCLPSVNTCVQSPSLPLSLLLSSFIFFSFGTHSSRAAQLLHAILSSPYGIIPVPSPSPTQASLHRSMSGFPVLLRGQVQPHVCVICQSLQCRVSITKM